MDPTINDQLYLGFSSSEDESDSEDEEETGPEETHGVLAKDITRKIKKWLVSTVAA